MTRKFGNFILPIIFMLCVTAAAWPGEEIPLPEIDRPEAIAAYKDRLYITQRATIFIYSLKDYKFIKSFGKEGEGPREFKKTVFGPPVTLVPYEDYLLINSDNKISFFTHDGEFIKEQRTMPYVVLIHAGKNFLGNGIKEKPSGEAVLTVTLYDGEFKAIKELYVTDIQVGQNISFSIPQAFLRFQVLDDKIFVVRGWGFDIGVYDFEGKELYTIEKKTEKIKVDSAYKERQLNWMKNESPFKTFWEYFKNRIDFKPEFPAIQDIVADDGKLYVLTHKKQGQKTECIVMDPKGKELKRVFLKVKEGTGFSLPIYIINQGTFYTLFEDLDAEQWLLYKTKI